MSFISGDANVSSPAQIPAALRRIVADIHSWMPHILRPREKYSQECNLCVAITQNVGKIRFCRTGNWELVVVGV